MAPTVTMFEILLIRAGEVPHASLLLFPAATAMWMLAEEAPDKAFSMASELPPPNDKDATEPLKFLFFFREL